MGDKEGKKRSKKGLFTVIAAAVGTILFMKKRKRGAQDSGWEEAKPDAS